MGNISNVDGYSVTDTSRGGAGMAALMALGYNQRAAVLKDAKAYSKCKITEKLILEHKDGSYVITEKI